MTSLAAHRMNPDTPIGQVPPLDRHGAAMEEALQMTPAVDRLRETLTDIRHYLTGGDGVNVEPMSPEDAVFISVLAARAAAYAHPSSQRDVDGAALATLQAICRVAIRELLRDEQHSEKALIAAAYQKLADKLATSQTIRHLQSTVGAVLDARVTLAVRHPHAIDMEGVIVPLDATDEGFQWQDTVPHCIGGTVREFCGEPLTIDGDPDAKPHVMHDQAGHAVVICEACQHTYPIAERIALVGVRR